jgi:hypothetical protein
MRMVSGFLAAAMLTAQAQPAWAVCVILGGVRNCHDFPEDWDSAAEPEDGPMTVEFPASDVPAQSDLKAIILQPSTETGNAWVLVPESGSGGATCDQGNRCD